MEIGIASRAPGFTTGCFLFVFGDCFLGGWGWFRVAHLFVLCVVFFLIWFVVVLSLTYSGLPILDLEKKSLKIIKCYNS